MKYFRHEYILLATTLVSALLYFSCRQASFSVDATLCGAFTAVVFGYAIRKAGRGLFYGSNARSVTEIVFAHVVCLAALVMVLRTGMFASMLPIWLTLPVVADYYGRIGPSGFQIAQGLTLLCLGYFEFRVLTDPRVRNIEKEEKKAVAALWKKAELDAERMGSLRLH